MHYINPSDEMIMVVIGLATFIIGGILALIMMKFFVKND